MFLGAPGLKIVSASLNFIFAFNQNDPKTVCHSMSGKNIFLIALALTLSVVYAVWFTDWFEPKTFTVFDTYRQMRGPRGAAANRAGGQPGEPTLIFSASRKVQLTELRVVPWEEWKTNRFVVPLWHLRSESNSVPVKNFFYGQHIAGMHPAIKGARPEFPRTNVTYRLILTAGKAVAEHNFTIK